MPSGQMKSRRGVPQVGTVAKALRRPYHDFAHHNKKDPYKELLYITCSTMTQGVVYRRVYASLIKAFPTLADIVVARRARLAKVLAPAGLGEVKAGHLLKACRALDKRHGPAAFSRLRRLDDDALERELDSLPGVGKKVARCVMLYSYGRAVFPVDTHCWRIAQRLGWVSLMTRAGPPAMDELQEMIPAHLRYSLHVNMVSHGIQVCRKRSPACDRCTLARLCPRRGV